MVTLLMAFFMMLYGMSILDLKKFDEFKAGVAKQLGKAPVMNGGAGMLLAGESIGQGAAPIAGLGNRNPGAEVRGEATRNDIASLVDEVGQRLHAAGLDGTATLESDPRGLVVYLQDHVLFGSGDAVMSVQGQQVLQQLAGVLAHIDNTFVVEGHTDDVPTRGSQWPSNWELSVARATNVLRFLVEGTGLPAPRASAAGFADTRPRVPNDTATHRAANRRVEIVIVIPPEEQPHAQQASL